MEFEFSDVICPGYLHKLLTKCSSIDDLFLLVCVLIRDGKIGMKINSSCAFFRTPNDGALSFREKNSISERSFLCFQSMLQYVIKTNYLS